MRAELRILFSPDVDDLQSYAPGDAFCVMLSALIGPQGESGEESFDFEICSPAWLAAELEGCRWISGRYRLIMARFDLASVEHYIAARLAQATGETWAEVAGKLSRWARWEFEDYKD